MKVLYEGSERIKKITGKKPAEGDYRLSGFVYLYGKDDVYRIKNILTCEIVGLTKDEFEFVSSLKEKTATLQEITDRGLEHLVKTRIFVDKSYDEIKQYRDVVFILKTMQKKVKGYSKFTILPTTGCNARCVYCFEAGFKPETMTRETADHLIRFITETKREGKLKLEWFGGEPFSARDIITHICKGLTDKGIEFESTIVTNGSLMTPEVIREAVDVWHLKSAQVSLDGKRKYYEERKDYYDKARFTYDLVLNNIGELARAGVRINLRCNMDDENISDIDEFLDDMYENFGKYENVSMYLAPLHQEMKRGTIVTLMKKIQDTYAYIKDSGRGSLIKKFGVPRPFRLNYCLGDSMDNVVVVMPDGSFTNCENLPEGRNWGNVREGITDMELYNKLKAEQEVDEMCRNCPFIPECTPYRKKQCPVKNDLCRECKELDLDHELLNLAVKEEGDPDDPDDNC
ncbi:MAG: radical SAM protein [Clostridiales bacterium]|nr:radical SAM protein [Clostridiales bacterium]